MTIDLTPNFEETSEKCSLVFRSSAPNDSKVRGFVVVVYDSKVRGFVVVVFDLSYYLVFLSIF
ncbi:hypothetical protein DPMN_192957 [Dreissena polymorpha]|uniref:Uncharacterized protein n=1 Tax=Dreissena polymorpha TaxID=45954 RepID=A0A9D3Y149_DREPO|nr:hypothetical protein DPMN_192957 [Dreissena polymorpha]